MHLNVNIFFFLSSGKEGILLDCNFFFCACFLFLSFLCKSIRGTQTCLVIWKWDLVLVLDMITKHRFAS